MHSDKDSDKDSGDMEKDLDEAIDMLETVLTGLEPKWKTHSMSLWNRMRRLITKHETGEVVSNALSFNPKTGTWEL